MKFLIFGFLALAACASTKPNSCKNNDKSDYCEKLRRGEPTAPAASHPDNSNYPNYGPLVTPVNGSTPTNLDPHYNGDTP